MDDREIAHHANLHVMGPEIGDRHRHRGLREKRRAIDQRLVGIGAIKIRRQDFVEPLDVGVLYRSDIVAVECDQLVDVLVH